MQKPSIGRIVITLGIDSNGSNEHPAIVNVVWGEGPNSSWMVNLTVFPDCAPPVSKTSVCLFDSRVEAKAYCDQQTVSVLVAAFWPERV